MSEIAEKTFITHFAPLERICYRAPRVQGLTPDRHQIQMQLQFLRLGVTWLPPALAMAELEHLLKGMTPTTVGYWKTSWIQPTGITWSPVDR
jgi:hypothetical protein